MANNPSTPIPPRSKSTVIGNIDNLFFFRRAVTVTQDNGTSFHGCEFLVGTSLFTEQFLPQLVFLRGGKGDTKCGSLEGSIEGGIVIDFTEVATPTPTVSKASGPSKFAVDIVSTKKGSRRIGSNVEL